MNTCCELSYNKKYSNATSCRIISNKMSFYNPFKFAEWLSNAYNESKFKSWQEVADKVGTTRSTLSRYAGAKPQTLTNKPSQPNADLVVKLAEVFGEDKNNALTLAGHAGGETAGYGKPQNPSEFFARLDEMGLDIQLDGGYRTLENLDADDLQELLDSVVANAVAKSKRKSRLGK